MDVEEFNRIKNMNERSVFPDRTIQKLTDEIERLNAVLSVYRDVAFDAQEKLRQVEKSGCCPEKIKMQQQESREVPRYADCHHFQVVMPNECPWCLKKKLEESNRLIGEVMKKTKCNCSAPLGGDKMHLPFCPWQMECIRNLHKSQKRKDVKLCFKCCKREASENFAVCEDCYQDPIRG